MATWVAPITLGAKSKQVTSSQVKRQPVVYNIALDSIPVREERVAPTETNNDSVNLCKEEHEDNKECVISPDDHPAYNGTEDQSSVATKSSSNELKLDLYSSVELKLDEELSTPRTVSDAKDQQNIAKMKYIARYKASLKLKGLQLEEIFAKNRNRSDKSRKPGRTNPGAKGNKRVKLPDIHNNSGNVEQPNAHQSTLKVENKPKAEKAAEESARETKIGTPKRKENNKLSLSCNDLSQNPDESSFGGSRTPNRVASLVEDYQTTPGRRLKDKNYGRQLGNIVSSDRMHQLLNHKEPLRMENFYNYYS